MTTSSNASGSAPVAAPEAASQKKTEVVSFDSPGTKPATASTEAGRTEMPVSAVARLLGVATATDLTLVEGKVDLMVNKMNALQTRMEKVLSTLNGMPTGADLERIDVQIGSLKTLMKDALTGVVGVAAPAAKKVEPAAKVEAAPKVDAAAKPEEPKA